MRPAAGGVLYLPGGDIRREEIHERITDALGADYELSVNYQAIALLESELGRDPIFARSVCMAFAKRAIAIERRLDQVPRDMEHSCMIACATLAARAVRVAGGAEERYAMIESLGPDGAASLMRALALKIADLACIAHGSTVWQQEREAAGRLLLQAASRESTEATQAVEEAALNASSARPAVRFWLC